MDANPGGHARRPESHCTGVLLFQSGSERLRPGGKATTTRNEEENLPERGSAGSPLETTLVGSRESVKVAEDTH